MLLILPVGTDEDSAVTGMPLRVSIFLILPIARDNARSGEGRIPPANGVNDRREILRLTKHLIGDSYLPIARDRDLRRFERRDGPMNIPERLADDGQSFRIVAQQICADTIHRPCVAPCQDQPQRERLRAKWPVSLAGYYRVHNVKNLPLGLLGHRSIRQSIQKNSIEVQTRTPYRVIS